MKILEIKDNKGYFLKESGYELVTNIGKDDLLYIANIIYDKDNEKIEMDDCKTIKINNKAEQIIYEKLYEYFKNFKSKKEEIKNAINENLLKISDKTID